MEDERRSLTPQTTLQDEEIQRVPSLMDKTSLILFSFFYIFDPSQPFFVEYLSTSKGISSNTIIHSIFPIWSYSLLPAQLIIGILSENKKIGHRLVISTGLILNLATLICVLLSTKDTLWLLQLSEVTVALSFAAHSSFFALRYHICDRIRYQFVTALTRGFMLLGSVLSSLLGQVVYLLHKQYDFIPLRILFYLAIIGTGPCLYVAIFRFPPPSEYVVPMRSEQESITLLQRIQKFVKEVISCYNHSSVMFWSLFVVLAVPVHHLALTYYQPLFSFVAKQQGSQLPVLNGFVISAAYLFAGLLSLIPTRFESFFDVHNEGTLFRFLGWGQLLALVLSFIGGICLLILSQFLIATVLRIAYIVFIIYHCTFEFLLVLAMSQIAKSLQVTRFAAIFSFNAALQNVIQLVFQIVVGEGMLTLEISELYQSLAYGMFAVSTLLFIFLVFRKTIYHLWSL